MPQKITSKNLSYNSSLPPFLAALRAQAGGASGPDPILAGQRRYGKKRSSSQDAEDAPLVVDEHGNAIDVELDSRGAVKQSPPPPPRHSPAVGAEARGDAPAGKADRHEAQGKFAFGGRKRKAGRAVGDAAATSPDDGRAAPAAPAAPAAASEGAGDGNEKHKPETSSRQAKKKAKKIKLSFEEDEG